MGTVTLKKCGYRFELVGKRINPRALLHGDRDGATIIPIEIVEELPDATDEYMSVESKFIKVMRGDDISPKELIEAESEFESEIEVLRSRVDRRPEDK